MVKKKIDGIEVESMTPEPKPEAEKPSIGGYLDLKLAVHKSSMSLCNSVEFRSIEETKTGYKLNIMLKGLSKEFNQLQGSRKLVEGLELTGATDPDIRDKIISLAHFSG